MSGISERNPFVGPRPIERGEPLHGRDVEVRELYNRLQARRIVVLHSPSGAGKSSLVQAGLIPRLVEGGFDVWKPIRVNLDPGDLEGIPEGTNRYLLSAMISLEDELPAPNRRPPAVLAGLDLREYLETRPRRKGRGNRPVVLIFDQFEEVLTVAALAVDAKRGFFAAVGQALEGEQFWALFLIREDHLAAFAPYRDRIPTQMSNTFRLDLLGLAGARETAKKLAEQGGRSFPAVDQLVLDLSRVQVQQADGSFVGEQGLYVEPVQLQVVCRRLWDAMPEDDLIIDPEDIAAYASVSEALGGYYADTVRVIADGDDAVERALRDWVGHKLIVGGIRSQLRQELNKTAGLDNRLIARLLDSYLVRTEPRAGAHWFELSHDRLVEPVQKNDDAWDQAHLHPLQVQAKQWEDARRSAGLLLSAGALPAAQAWAREHPTLLTEGEREFLEQSQKLRGREQAAQRRLIALAEVAGLVAAAISSDPSPGARLPVSDADRAAFRERNEAVLLERFRQGLYVGVAMGLVLTPATWWAYPALSLGFVLCPVAASGIMVAASFATRIPGMARGATAHCCVSTYAVGTLAAFVATATGGFQSPYFLIQFLICTFATAFLPLSPRTLLLACVPNSLFTVAIILAFSPQPGAMVLPVLLSAGGLVYAYFGVVLRYQADLQSFVAHARLAEAQASLAELDGDV